MKIAFLGGTRFIGLRSVLLAREQGHEVAVLHRGIHQAALPSGIRELIVDREDVSALTASLKKEQADVLVDCFAMTRNQTQKTLKALRGNVGRVVVLSSQDVYAQFGRLNGLAAPEVEDLVSEASPQTVPYPFRGIAEHAGGAEYDKKDVESLYKSATGEALASTVILRLPAVYGQKDYQRRLCAVIHKLDAGEKVLPCQDRASWRWTHGHVTNMAHAIVLASEKTPLGFHLFNVGESATPTMRDRVEKICQILGKSIDWAEAKTLPDELSILGKMPNDFIVSTAKIRTELGYSEILDEEGCYTDLIAWSRECRKPRPSIPGI